MLLYCSLTVPTVRPAEVSVDVAADSVVPTTFGTVTGCTPSDTTRFTALPGATCVPADGDWLITWPAGIVLLYCSLTVPTVRPAEVRVDAAADCVVPTTFGTVTGCTPSDTTRFTALPGATCAPADGDWLITWPAGTVLLYCSLTVPTVRPATASVSSATERWSPTTSGTDTSSAPIETVSATGLPSGTSVLAAGVWSITSSAGTVLLYAYETRTEKPELPSVVVAFASVWPVTSGTTHCGKLARYGYEPPTSMYQTALKSHPAPVKVVRVCICAVGSPVPPPDCATPLVSTSQNEYSTTPPSFWPTRPPALAPVPVTAPVA